MTSLIKCCLFVLLFCGCNFSANAYSNYTDYFKDKSDEYTVSKIKKLSKDGDLNAAKLMCLEWLHYEEKIHGPETIHSNIPLILLGRICLIRQEYEEALASFQRSLSILDETTGWLYPDYAVTLNHLATVHLRLGETEISKKILNEVVSIHEKTIDANNINQSHYLFNLALLAMNEGQFDLAEKHFLSAKEISINVTFRRLIDSNFREIDIFLSHLYTKTYRQKEAIEILNQLLLDIEKDNCQKSANYSRVLLALGVAYKVDGKYDLAIASFKKAEKLVKFQTNSQHPAYAWVLREIANLLMLQTNYKEAEKLLSAAISIYKLNKNENIRYVNTLVDLANIYLETGRYKEAAGLLTKGNQLVGDKKKYNYYLKNTEARLAIIHGQFVDAEITLSENIDLMRQDNQMYLRDFTTSALDLVELNIYLGRTQKAENTIKRGLTFLEDIYQKGSLNYIDVITTRAYLYSVQGKAELSLQDLFNAQNYLLDKFGKDHLSNGDLNGFLAYYYGNLGENEKAEKYYQEAIRVFKAKVTPKAVHYIRVQKFYADFLVKNKKYDEAIAIYKSIYKNTLPKTLINTTVKAALAYVYALNSEWKLAEELIIESVKDRFSFYDNTLAYSSTQEKEQYLHKTSEVFDTFYAILNLEGVNASKSMIENCYNLQIRYRDFFLEQTKQRSDHLLKYKDDRLKQGFPSYTDYMINFRGRIASLNYFSKEQRDELGVDPYKIIDRVNTLEKSLVYAADAYNDSTAITKLTTWKDVQAKLTADEIAIEIVKLRTLDKRNSEYIALCVTKASDTPIMIPLGHSSILEDVAFYQYQKQISPLGRSLIFVDSETTKKDPYTVYWKPINDKIKEGGKSYSTIYFCADGIYSLLNLNTLRNPRTEKYLIEEEFIYKLTSSTELIKEKRTRHNIDKTAMLIGNPIFNKVDGSQQDTTTRQSRGSVAKGLSIKLDELPGTAAEIKSLESLLIECDWDVEVFTQENAKEALLKGIEKSPSVIHIATHGFFLNSLKNPISSNPMLRSGLFFTEFSEIEERTLEEIYLSGIDGILTAYEVTTLDLKDTELIILSACQTGVSEVIEGEGISGLQYAFSIAGAKSIVMSLWNVDDEATQKLMTKFYTYWKEGKNRHEAFRKAQLDIMNEFKKPYYWGAFVIVN
ncbi:CHAT domain-containing protein [Flammeovirga kamogawensis]|uniref:CHAT domain-containing protein n=1 Tax=Flammeovirga kamogawensis TaxID=373891 RepID=A0ABX8GV75_9BACT|nr:CHAT domain-containing protein [Flammeovirga kamogawensis]MBB6459629.1 CHAT domain-containing protein/3-methyladenine DNA glycosylase AlkD [Flammeovirga kamogawensis]QWG07308.1 CHAT domain-containing protein [Flammeovirga kamogawensis]TRX69125.1 CHAT domain-containing protein [Flammeovirga kamogawensis]